MKKIESHPHRQNLQAGLQQDNVYNAFSEKSKKIIQEMDFVELFELCETVPKCNAQNAFFTGIKASFTELVVISERESIQPTFPPMAIASSLNPELCH